jgi:outer membrane protein OmpA-like peptidoglycan-associated protein
MPNNKKRGRPGPALTIGIPLALAAFAGSFAYQYYKDMKGAETPNVTATAEPLGPVKFRVAADPWSGYSTFRDEPRFKALLEKSQISVEYLADEKYYDQNERMKALASGEIDIALTTLDAFLQHGSKNLSDGKYPGIILFGIDESSGGDAIFLEKGRNSFDEVKDTDKVCYSTGTPSEHLWDFASLSFARLGDKLGTDNGVVAQDCWKKLEQKEVQIAVLWQPYTALASQAGYSKVFATGGQADDVILDIAVANRAVREKHAAALQRLVAAYFETIESYRRDVKAHAEFVTKDCGPDCKNDNNLGLAVLEGIDFLTFEENLCIWFGHCASPSKLEPRVEKTARLLIAKGKLDAAAVPAAKSIIDDTFVLGLKRERVEAAKLAQAVAGPDTDVELPTFSAQDPTYDYTVPGAEGNANIGTLQLPDVFFREGSYGLTDDARATIVTIADKLQSFPALCVRIAGHTNSNGDPAANRKLSKFRGMAIAAELTRLNAAAFPKERFDVRGLGSDQPILLDGREDPSASRRTEFTLYNCGAAG